MKKSELKEYIKDRIRETLYAGPEAAKKVNQDPNFAKLKTTERPDIIKRLQRGGSVELEEIDLDEMARAAAVLKVAPNYRDLAKDIKTGGPIGPAKLKAVLDFLADKDQITGPEIATGIGYAKMPAIYPIYAALIDVGALVPTEKEKTVEVPDEPENKNFDDILDVPEEPTEPELPAAKKTAPLSTTAQKAAMFTVDNADLISKIIRLYKDSRTRLGEILREAEDDLSPQDYKKTIQQSKENSLDILNDKIKELVDKIKQLEPDVQEKVLDTLVFKFNSVNANNLAKIIYDKLDMSYQDTADDYSDEDFIDFDDEEISEDVDDIDYGGTDFKDYDDVY